MRHYVTIENGLNNHRKVELSELETATLVAYRRGFVDVDVDSSPGKTRITCTDHSGRVKATYNGRTTSEACKKLIETLWDELCGENV